MLPVPNIAVGTEEVLERYLRGGRMGGRMRAGTRGGGLTARANGKSEQRLLTVCFYHGEIIKSFTLCISF